MDARGKGETARGIEGPHVDARANHCGVSFWGESLLGDLCWSDSFWGLAGCTAVDSRAVAAARLQVWSAKRCSLIASSYEHHWWAGIEQRRERSQTRVQERMVMQKRVLRCGLLCVRDQKLRKVS